MGYYVIRYVSDIFTQQEDTTIDSQVSKYGKLAVKSKYLSEMKFKNYWEQ